MIQQLKLPGDLKFGQHKSISCAVQLCIDTHDMDAPDYDPEKYYNGICVTGEFHFDTSPIGYDKHPVKSNAIGELTIRDGQDNSKLNILVTEKSGESVLLEQRLKRYFWQFFVIGKPTWDQLEIFPKDYQGLSKVNRIFACTNFRGYWPVGVASVVVASDKNEARELLDKKLKEAKIPVETGGEYDLVEIPLQEKGAVILNNGDWK